MANRDSLSREYSSPPRSRDKLLYNRESSSCASLTNCKNRRSTIEHGLPCSKRVLDGPRRRHTYLFDRDRFRQVSRAIHVATAKDRDVERQQLHRNDRENSLETVDRLRHFENSVCERFRFRVSLLADHDWLAVSGCHLLQCVHAFLKKDSRCDDKATRLSGK